jgi:DNA-binding response OmpR family regulator
MTRGTETILVAEDDEYTRKFMKQALEEFGYHVIEAVDGEDAVSVFFGNMDKIQIVILDVVMPRKNGKEAYDLIREVKHDIPVLFISGYTADIINRKGVLEEGMNFISKPLSPYPLLSKVREVLAQAQPQNKQMAMGPAI